MKLNYIVYLQTIDKNSAFNKAKKFSLYVF